MTKKIIVASISIIVIITGVVCFKFYKEKSSKQMIGILQKDLYDPSTEFLGTYSKKKEDPKFAGYITGEDIESTDTTITTDFKESTINIFNVELKYPSFFRNFSPVEVSDGLINLIATKPKENRIYENNLSIWANKLDKSCTLEEYKEHYTSMYSTVAKLENSKIEGDKLMMYFNLNYEPGGYTEKDIKQYVLIEIKNEVGS